MTFTRSTLWAAVAALALSACQGEETSLTGVRGRADLAPANGETCFGVEPTHVLVPGGKGTNGTTFKGTNGDDVILGTEGDDIINGAGGNDLICGLGGNDNLTGGPGDDSIDGGDGNDNLTGGPGDDWIDGGDGDDTMNGGVGADLLYGGAGVDLIFGAEDDDGLFGGDGNDHLQGGGGADSLFGGAGDDLMRGSGRRGADGGDRMFGEDGNDTMLGDMGDDTMSGGAGNDVILGDSGDDALDGGADNDQCIGGGQAGDTITNCEALFFSLFLHNRSTQPSTATTSLANLPMNGTVPTNAGALPNYDTDRDAFTGRLIQKDTESATQSDLGKYQNWFSSFTMPLVLDKAVSPQLRIWTAMKDLSSSKAGRIRVYIRDCPGTPQTSCTVIGQGDFLRPNGAAFSESVITVPWTFAGTSYILATGRSLEVKVVVRSSSDDDMWFGYDTAALQARVEYAP